MPEKSAQNFPTLHIHAVSLTTNVLQNKYARQESNPEPSGPKPEFIQILYFLIYSFLLL